MSFVNTFISTKAPTSNPHVVNKIYADGLRPPALSNGLLNTLELSNAGVVSYNANGHNEYLKYTPDANQVTELVSKRRLKV